MTYTRDGIIYIVKEISLDNKILWHLSTRPSMSDAEYDAVKYRLERLGGHWRERFGGFVFDTNPMPALHDAATWAPIEHTEYERWKILRQFYPTPAPVAERVVELCEISDEHTVLEPSAGKAALLKPLHRTERIQTVEIDGGLAAGLRDMGYAVINSSFEDAANNLEPVDRIVMNPPFSQQRDIKHIMLAYELLKEGGILVAIMSENDLYYDTPLTKEFNRFLKEKDAYIEEIPMRAFAESQTSVDTVIVKIKK